MGAADHLGERLPAGGAVLLEEGRLRFDDRRHGGGRRDDAAAELPAARGRRAIAVPGLGLRGIPGAHLGRQLGEIRVEADADDAAPLVDGLRESVGEVPHFTPQFVT